MRARVLFRPILGILIAVSGRSGELAAGYEFDGRLPVSSAEPLSPATPGPDHLRQFWSVHGPDFRIYWDHLLETPRYISPRRPTSLFEPVDSSTVVLRAALEAACRRLVDRTPEFFGVSSHDLAEPMIRQVDDLWLVVFRQTVGEVFIRGANLRFLVGEDGRLISVTGFTLRDAPDLVPAFASPSPTRAWLEEERGHLVLDEERQLWFPRHDPASIRPVWRLHARTPEETMVEVFADAASGEPIEERLFVFELSVIQGEILGRCPTTKREDNHYFFTTPASMSPEPDQAIRNARVAGVAAATTTDETGGFNLIVPGASDAIEWHLELNECAGETLFHPVYGENCRPNPEDFRPLVQLYSKASGCRPLERFGLPSPLVQPAETHVTFRINPSGSVLDSARLMSHHHLSVAIKDHRRRINDFGLQPVHDLPLRMVLDTEEGSRMDYLPTILDTTICAPVRLRTNRSVVNGESFQWLTPSLLYHEFAHHAIFELTGGLHGKLLDCFDATRPTSPCVSNEDDPEILREMALTEGAADALAAFAMERSRFGYYHPEDDALRGPLAYDIARPGNTNLDSDRETVAGIFWGIREQFISGSTFLLESTEEAEAKLVFELLYRWVSSHAVDDPGDRSFFLSPAFIQELKDQTAALASEDTEKARRNRRVLIDQVASGISTLLRAPFIRSDSDGNGVIDITDPIHTLTYSFLGGEPGPCRDAMDTDDSGVIDITDAINSLNHMFLGTAMPAAPYPDCGLDPTNDADVFLHCERVDGCPDS